MSPATTSPRPASPSAGRGSQAATLLSFGRPAQVYQADGYTIMVWPMNLLAKLG